MVLLIKYWHFLKKQTKKATTEKNTQTKTNQTKPHDPEQSWL